MAQEGLAKAQVLWEALRGAELPSLEALQRLSLLGAQGGHCVAALRALHATSGDPGAGAACGVGDLSAALVRALNALALEPDVSVASAAEEARQEVCNFALDVIRGAHSDDRLVDTCCRAVEDAVTHTQAAHVAQTGDAIAALFRAQPLPKVASLVVTACEVALRGPAGCLCVTLPCGMSQSGAQYSERLIQATLSPHWPPRQAAGIAACLAGGPLTPALGDALAAKVSSALRTAATQDWPSMCHHAWAAAASGGGDVGLALNRCVSTLESLSEPQMSGAAAQSARCNAQGVVLMTLERDASQPRLGEAFARACSTGTLCQSQSSLGGQTTMPGPFRCAVLLALARATHALEEAALLALHEAVLKSFSHGGGGRRADGSVHSPSPWLTSLAVQQGAAASGGQVGQHPLLEVVACTTIGWDLIVPSLVALSLRMLDALPTSTATDAYDPLVDALAAVAAMDATGSEGDVSTNSLFTPHAQTAALGVHLLLTTFKHHDSARRTIIRACATQLAGATTSSGGGGGGSRARATSAGGLTPSGAVHARLLVSLCRAYPAAVAPHGECLRDAFHHAACLSPEVTSALLLCIRPLHALAPQLQEHCALALRKALFDTAPGRAGAAARGVLHQALQATIAAASGRNPGLGDDGAGPSQDRPAVSLQLGGFLRRCLTQDAAVRRCAYRGLAGLAEADPHGHGAATAASTLLSQLSRYVSHTPGGGAGTQGGATATRRDSIEDADVDDDDDGIQPAFQLAACVTQPAQGDAAAGGASAAAAVVVEPFASLLRACWDVTAAVAAAGEGPHAVSASVVNQLRECTWKTLHKLLSTCEDSVAWEEAYGVAGAVTGGAADGATTGPQAYDATSAARAQVLCASLQVAVDWAMHELLASRLKLTPAWREALGRAMACHTRMRLRMAAAARAANKKGAAGAPAPDADDATAADGGDGTAAPATGTLARSGRGGIGASVGASRGGRRSEGEVGMRGASLVALLNAMTDPNDLAGVLPRDKEKGAAGFPGAPVVNTATSTQFVVHAAAEALHAGSDSTWLLSLAAGHVDDMAVVRALAPSCSMVSATVGHARPDTSGRSIAAALLRVLAQLVMSTVRGGGAAGAGADVTPSKGQPKGKASGGGTGKPGRQAVLVDPPMRVVLTAVEAYLRRCASRGGLDGMRDAAAALSTAFSTTRRVSMEPESSSSDDDEDDAMPVAQAMGKQKQGRGGQLVPAMSNTDLAAGLKAGVLKLQSLITNAVGVKAMAKDTACLLACVGHITTMFARATNRPCTDTANWALKTITTQAVIADATSAQALAWLAVQLRTPPADANGAQVICEALRSAHGCDQMDADGVSPDDDDDEDGAAKKWASVKQSLTAGALAVGVLRWADGVLSDVEWLMTVLKAHVKAMEHLGVGLRGGGDGEEEEEGDEEDAAQRTGLRASALAAVKHRRALEDAVCGRLTELVPVVASIMGTLLPLQSCDAAVKCSTRVMKAVTTIVLLSTPSTKKGRKTAKEGDAAPPGGGDQGGGRGVVGHACCALVHAVDRELVETAYQFVQRVEEVRPDQVKEKGTGKKRKQKKGDGASKKKKRKGGDESEEEDEEDEDSDGPPAGRGGPPGKAKCSAASLKRVVKQLPGLIYSCEAMRRATAALNAAHGGHTAVLKYAKLLPKRDFKYQAN